MTNDVRYGAFIWDMEKDKANIRQHGIGFQKAAEAFSDPRRIIAKDDAHSKDEERLFCIGSIGARIVTVRFTFRGRIVRIFGAGFWRKGRKTYEKSNLHR